MGITSDAILVFGVDLGERGEVEVPWRKAFDDEDDDGEGGFDDWLAELAGASTDAIWEQHAEWLNRHPELGRLTSREQVDAWEKEHPELRDALNAAYKKQREAKEACPIDVVLHGAFDMEIVAVRGTAVTAYLGAPQKLRLIDLDAIAMNNAPAALAFCKEHAIPFEDPTWLLASLYG